MQGQRSHQSHVQPPPRPRWTRCSRRRCTSSPAPPHDGTQGNRRNRLLVHLSPLGFSVPGRINRKIMHFPTAFTCTVSMVPPGACISQGEFYFQGVFAEGQTFSAAGLELNLLCISAARNQYLFSQKCIFSLRISLSYSQKRLLTHLTQTHTNLLCECAR